ncbi:hypothetical protein RD792_018134, partial [Penstemon davidsonii]
RKVVENNEVFSVPKFPLQFCNFMRDFTQTYPGFAWMKCKEGVDCEKLLKGHNILSRSGKRLGSDVEYVRISMMGNDEDFDLFLQRLSTIHGMSNGN